MTVDLRAQLAGGDRRSSGRANDVAALVVSDPRLCEMLLALLRDAATIRSCIVELCGWLGLRLDPEANQSGATRISRPDSAVKVLVIPTDEQGRGLAALLAAGKLGVEKERR